MTVNYYLDGDYWSAAYRVGQHQPRYAIYGAVQDERIAVVQRRKLLRTGGRWLPRFFVIETSYMRGKANLSDEKPYQTLKDAVIAVRDDYKAGQ